MEAHLALALCLAFVAALFLIDEAQEQNWSPGLWVPLGWMFFAGSRFGSHWLNAMTSGNSFGVDNINDGSPVDRFVFIVFIGASLVIVRRRKVNWTTLLSRNKLVWMFFLFGLVSVLWSEFPLVIFRRLPKAIGNAVIALVILTDPEPSRATAAVLRRLCYLTMPLSIVFIKYFPTLGRAYTSSGLAMYTGVGMQKNSLGQLCLLGLTYCAWSLLFKPATRVVVGNGIRVEWVLLPMILWLLSMSNSATSLTCAIAACLVFGLAKLPFAKSPARLVSAAVAIFALSAVLEWSLNISSNVIEWLGRRPDLTTRVPMWEDMLARAQGNPWLGVGFESYWLSKPGQVTMDVWKVPNAHNGYLETYLSSGLIGLFILCAGLAITFYKILRHDRDDMAGAVMRLAFLLTVIFYNWTESTFRGVSNIWVLFFLSTMETMRLSRAELPVVQRQVLTPGQVLRNRGGTMPAPALPVPGQRLRKRFAAGDRIGLSERVRVNVRRVVE